MITDRLRFALERLESGDWHRFERLASGFLACEFDDLRTTANTSGDEGRDSELFSPSSEPKIVLQYSVASDWIKKVNATVRRLKATIPDALTLIYVSNQVIGAKADAIKRTLRQSGLTLDIRDRSWFVERVHGSIACEKVAEELAQAIVDPYLASTGIGPHINAELSSPEAIAAVMYLGLQWRDDSRDKGLTKLAFEALVRSVLINTDSERRETRSQIYAMVVQLLPGHPQQQLTALVDAALNRLNKRAVRHWQKEDEFCLSHEEVQRVNQFRISSALAESEMLVVVREISQSILVAQQLSDAHETELTRCLRSATDAVLFERSQAFAMAVQTGSLAALANSDFTSALLSELSKASLPKTPNADWLAILRTGVRQILISDEPAVQVHMRSLSDSYTLLAFLRQTPDVQGVVEKMFSHGLLWLDSTVVLPLLAETLNSTDAYVGRFTRMVNAARDAGLGLFVTPGVVEEVERHMNRALTCARLTYGRWEGSLPYLLERYIEDGRSSASFPVWLEHFRGDTRPMQDISEYLKDEFGISTRSLETERDAAPTDLRHALQQLWYERYQRRKERYGTPLDDMAVTRLINHDIECYCGITELRTREHASPFGYSAWWLTVDRQTFDLKEKLRARMSGAPPDSPVMSADFMINYLAFGPVRRRVGKRAEASLPLLMVLGSASHLTPELMLEADALRADLKDLPDRVVRRKVRDHLDRARCRVGPIANAGMDEIEEALQRGIETTVF